MEVNADDIQYILHVLFSLGEWYEGRWHGQGNATFTNGDTYDGQYSFDQRHGRGAYSWNDGRVYSGGFVADRREGQGSYTWPDGAKYEGYFRDGQHDGQGEYRVSKKTILLEGFGCCRRISLLHPFFCLCSLPMDRYTKVLGGRVFIMVLGK
jgi:hypothetical protein